MIWTTGLVLFCIYRVFNAGMKSKSLFYSTSMTYNFDFTKKVPVEQLDGEKIFFYAATTVGIGITWPVSLPLLGIYLLGKRYAK